MASEKFRKELKDDGKMSVFSRVLLGASILQLVVMLGAFMITSADSMMLVFLGVVGVIMLVVSMFFWDAVPAFRRTARVLLLALVGALIAIGLGCAIYTVNAAPSTDAALNLSASSADADPGYIFLFDMALVLWFVQTILSFLLPTLVVAADTGRRFDGILFAAMSTLHAGIIAFMVFYTSQSIIGLPTWNTEEILMPSWTLGGSIEVSLVQIVVLVLTAAFAVMSIAALFVNKKKAA
ncbi:MAG: hypothetical protein IKV35_05645 [Clostridia bacterium]|nr:hypothetical protein [Clostridia bacterium]